MSWVDLFVAFMVAHVVGDFLLQTDWQALHKGGGLGRDGVARRALLSHVAVYLLAFLPALVWLGAETSALVAGGTALMIAVPHLVVDDGRLLEGYLRRVKGFDGGLASGVGRSVDQSFHLFFLWAAATIAAG